GQLEDHVSVMVGRERTRMLKLASTCQTGSLILSDSVQRIRSCPGTIVRNETQLAGLQSTLQARKDQTLRQIRGIFAWNRASVPHLRRQRRTSCKVSCPFGERGDWSWVKQSGNTNFKRS